MRPGCGVAFVRLKVSMSVPVALRSRNAAYLVIWRTIRGAVRRPLAAGPEHRHAIAIDHENGDREVAIIEEIGRQALGRFERSAEFREWR